MRHRPRGIRATPLGAIILLVMLWSQRGVGVRSDQFCEEVRECGGTVTARAVTSHQTKWMISGWLGDTGQDGTPRGGSVDPSKAPPRAITIEVRNAQGIGEEDERSFADRIFEQA